MICCPPIPIPSVSQSSLPGGQNIGKINWLVIKKNEKRQTLSIITSWIIRKLWTNPPPSNHIKTHKRPPKVKNKSLHLVIGVHRLIMNDVHVFRLFTSKIQMFRPIDYVAHFRSPGKLIRSYGKKRVTHTTHTNDSNAIVMITIPTTGWRWCWRGVGGEG